MNYYYLVSYIKKGMQGKSILKQDPEGCQEG